MASRPKSASCVRMKAQRCRVGDRAPGHRGREGEVAGLPGRPAEDPLAHAVVGARLDEGHEAVLGAQAASVDQEDRQGRTPRGSAGRDGDDRHFAGFPPAACDAGLEQRPRDRLGRHVGDRGTRPTIEGPGPSRAPVRGGDAAPPSSWSGEADPRSSRPSGGPPAIRAVYASPPAAPRRADATPWPSWSRGSIPAARIAFCQE